MRITAQVLCLFVIVPFHFAEEELPQVKNMKEVYQKEIDRFTRGFNTPTGSYSSPIAVTAGKRWRDHSWLFSRAKYTSPNTGIEAKEIRMVIQVLPGSGDIFFRDIEITKM